MIGDFYRNYGYPYIDVANGGSLKGMLEGLDPRWSLPADTKLVQSWHDHQARGHRPYRKHDFRRPGKVQQLIAQGKTLQRAGREDHRALRRESSGDFSRPVQGRAPTGSSPGVSATQGRG